MLKAYQGIFPEIHDTAFVEDSAQVIGDVKIGRESSVWFYAVIRGDVQPIRIGERTNIQDGVVVHGTSGKSPVIIGDDVTIGHCAIVHGAVINSNCLIGMGAIVLDDAEVGENCIVGAGTVVPERMRIPPNSLVLGVPGKIVRSVTAEEAHQLTDQAARYVKHKNAYLF